MRIRPQHVNDVRAVVLWILRLAGLWMILSSIARIVPQVVWQTLRTSSTWSWAGLWNDFLTEYYFAAGFQVTLGLLLFFGSRRLSNWMIALPKQGCPACGHETATNEGCCAECGLKM